MSDIDPVALGIIVALVICGAMVVHVLSNISRIVKQMKELEVAKSKCPPHNWIYVYTDQTMEHVYMVCENCNGRAGQIE